MDGMTKDAFLHHIEIVINSPRNDLGKIDMLKAGFEQFLNDAENKIMFQRPENLNPQHETNGDYNRGWNDCSSRWIDIIHNFEKESVTIPECQGDEG
jgi:hypothetical protein